MPEITFQATIIRVSWDPNSEENPDPIVTIDYHEDPGVVTFPIKDAPHHIQEAVSEWGSMIGKPALFTLHVEPWEEFQEKPRETLPGQLGNSGQDLT